MMVRLLRRALTWLVALAFLYSFAAYVWPTRYRYDTIVTDNESYPVRIDRFTGEGEMLTPDEGWVPMSPEGDVGPADDDRSRTS